GEKDFWGFVWQGAAGEDLTCSGLEWQVSEGGGGIIEDDKTISVNNPQAIRAWQRAARWVGFISPPGVVAYGESDSDNVWSSGKAAFHRAWVSDYSLVASHPTPGKCYPVWRNQRAGRLGRASRHLGGKRSGDFPNFGAPA